MSKPTIDHAALLEKARELCGCVACVLPSSPAEGVARQYHTAPGCPLAAAVYTQLCNQATDEGDDYLRQQIDEGEATAGLLADVCDAAFSASDYAETMGYEGVLKRVQLLANVALTAERMRSAVVSRNHVEHAEAELWNALADLARTDPAVTNEEP